MIIVKDPVSGTATTTEGFVSEILTETSEHVRGIKVRLKDGSIGRVQQILPYKPLHSLKKNFEN